MFPSHDHGQFSVGRVIREVPNYKGPRIIDWVVSKIDKTEHQTFIDQEARITNLHKKLNVIWGEKDGTSKLDILFEELLQKEQEEASAINETLV